MLALSSSPQSMSHGLGFLTYQLQILVQWNTGALARGLEALPGVQRWGQPAPCSLCGTVPGA